MNLIVENWKKFIGEGMNDEQHDFKYYAFDWDDNIAYMPTKIILLDKSGKEVGMGSQDFAELRGMIGKEEFDYEGHIIKDFAPNAFRNFRPEMDKAFELEALRAKPGPSWDDFVECINSASIFAIITARGHRPSTIKKAIKTMILRNHNGLDMGMLKDNIKKYNELFNKKHRDTSLDGYLNLCKFYPVSYGPMAASMGSPEEAKVKALEEFVKYCKNLNVDMPIKMGFSDDDKRNIDLIEKHFKEPRELVDMTIKFTGKQHGEE